MTADARGSAAVSGIVLAGGASRRFGADKLAAVIDGVTLLDLAVQSLSGIVGEIVVVVAPGRPLPDIGPAIDRGEAGGHLAELRLATDPEPFGGPLVGLRSGLLAARGSRVIVIGGDMPSVVPAVLVLLGERAPAALADDEGILRPLPCALDRAPALTVAERLLGGGERRLRTLLAELGVEPIPRAEWAPADPAGASLLDVDEPADLPGSSRAPTSRSGPWREEEPGP